MATYLTTVTGVLTLLDEFNIDQYLNAYTELGGDDVFAPAPETPPVIRVAIDSVTVGDPIQFTFTTTPPAENFPVGRIVSLEETGVWGVDGFYYTIEEYISPNTVTLRNNNSGLMVESGNDEAGVTSGYLRDAYYEFNDYESPDAVPDIIGTVQKKQCSERWGYQYRLPRNYSNARFLCTENYPVRPDAPSLPHEITSDNAGERVLLTDVQDAILVFTKTPASYSELPRQVLLAVAYKMAALMAFPVTRDQKVVTLMEKQYQAALHSAIEKDANSQRADRDPRNESLHSFDSEADSNRW